MNREKAIDLLDNLIGMIEDNQESDYDTALKMAIQALSQEPCDDAISRENAITSINKLYEECEEWRALNDLQYGKNQGLSLAIDVIEDLSPVTPSCDKCAMNGSGSKYCNNCGQKSGKWISLENRFELGDRVRCSNCGQVFVVGDDVSRHFCPNCGCRMIEPQESEKDACKDCYYNDGEVHAECVICDKAESEE